MNKYDRQMIDNINMINHTSQQKTTEMPMEVAENKQRFWGKNLWGKNS